MRTKTLKWTLLSSEQQASVLKEIREQRCISKLPTYMRNVLKGSKMYWGVVPTIVYEDDKLVEISCTVLKSLRTLRYERFLIPSGQLISTDPFDHS